MPVTFSRSGTATRRPVTYLRTPRNSSGKILLHFHLTYRCLVSGNASCAVEGEFCDIEGVADKLLAIMDDTAKTPDTVSKKPVNVSLFSDSVCSQFLFICCLQFMQSLSIFMWDMIGLVANRSAQFVKLRKMAVEIAQDVYRTYISPQNSASVLVLVCFSITVKIGSRGCYREGKHPVGPSN